MREEDGEHWSVTAPASPMSLVVVPCGYKEFLLLIHSGADEQGSEPEEIGRRYDLEKETVLIGRGPDNDIILDLSTVSRRHARIDRRDGTTHLTDLQSTNGTYIDDQRIPPHTPRVMPQPARIIIGRAVFKYQVADNIEAQHAAEMYRLKITDGLTGLANRRRLVEILSQEVRKARNHRRGLSIVMADVDHFSRINETLGHFAGDHVLRELARFLPAFCPHGTFLGRLGGDEFVLVLPQTGKEQAREVAEEMRRRVEACAFPLADRRIPITISLGVAEVADGGADLSVDGLLDIADRRLYAAKEAGRNRVAVTQDPAAVRRLDDAGILLRDLLDGEQSFAVAVLALADEGAIIDCLGAGTRDTWLRDVTDDARLVLTPRDRIARHEGRFVVLALDDTCSGGDGDARLGEIRARFRQREVPAGSDQRVRRELLAASLPSSALRDHGPRTWDKLIGRLARATDDAGRSGWERLPAPLALALSEIDATETRLERIKAAAWAIEIALRFLAAAAIASARRRLPPDNAFAAVVTKYTGRKISFGGWLEILVDLARTGCVSPPMPFAKLIGDFLGPGARPSALAKLVEEAVGIRNRDYGHGPAAADETLERSASRIRSLAEQFANQFAAVEEASLVSVAAILDLKPDGRVSYRLHVHRGASGRPVLEERDLRTQLCKGWGYLAHPSLEVPLLLAPVVLAGVGENSRREETFFADALQFGPSGVRIRGRAVLGKDDFKAELPWTEESRILFEKVTAHAAMVNTSTWIRVAQCTPGTPPEDPGRRTG